MSIVNELNNERNNIIKLMDNNEEMLNNIIDNYSKTKILSSDDIQKLYKNVLNVSTNLNNAINKSKQEILNLTKEKDEKEKELEECQDKLKEKGIKLSGGSNKIFGGLSGLSIPY